VEGLPARLAAQGATASFAEEAAAA
jgi:hypothetical protein